MTRLLNKVVCSVALFVVAVAAFLSADNVSGYAFVAKRNAVTRTQPKPPLAPKRLPARTMTTSTSLHMVDQATLEGAGIAIAGLAVGIGLVAFTEAQGERAKQRGSGLSDSMATRIAGGLLEDVEVSSVDDVGSLTSQLEQALRESGGVDEEDVRMTEEDKKRIAEEADDGW